MAGARIRLKNEIESNRLLSAQAGSAMRDQYLAMEEDMEEVYDCYETQTYAVKGKKLNTNM